MSRPALRTNVTRDPNGRMCTACEERFTEDSFYRNNRRCKQCANNKVQVKHRVPKPPPAKVIRATYVVKEINGCKIPVYTRVESAW